MKSDASSPGVTLRETTRHGDGSEWRGVRIVRPPDMTPGSMAQVIRKCPAAPPCVTDAMGAHMAAELASRGSCRIGWTDWEVVP